MRAPCLRHRAGARARGHACPLFFVFSHGRARSALPALPPSLHPTRQRKRAAATGGSPRRRGHDQSVVVPQNAGSHAHADRDAAATSIAPRSSGYGKHDDSRRRRRPARRRGGGGGGGGRKLALELRDAARERVSRARAARTPAAGPSAAARLSGRARAAPPPRARGVGHRPRRRAAARARPAPGRARRRGRLLQRRRPAAARRPPRRAPRRPRRALGRGGRPRSRARLRVRPSRRPPPARGRQPQPRPRARGADERDAARGPRAARGRGDDVVALAARWAGLLIAELLAHARQTPLEGAAVLLQARCERRDGSAAPPPSPDVSAPQPPPSA